MMGGWDSGWWMLMWLWMAAFWVVVIGAVLWAATRRGRDSGHSASSALDTLDRRFASGEITVDEYRRTKNELGDGGSRDSGRAGYFLIAGVTALALLLFVAGPVWAVADSDWDMWDHMGRMMGGGRGSSNAPLIVGGQEESVAIGDFSFAPGNLQVPVGATVTWTNRDSVPHNATSRDRSWQTATLSRGETGSVTFDSVGEYDYFCTIHPSMKAHLSVE